MQIATLDKVIEILGVADAEFIDDVSLLEGVNTCFRLKCCASNG
jgi:hypothetical protein